jgi:hypothetical protein
MSPPRGTRTRRVYNEGGMKTGVYEFKGEACGIKYKTGNAHAMSLTDPPLALYNSDQTH